MMIRLTPEEVSLLKEACRREKEILNKYKEYFKSIESVDTDNLREKKDLLTKSKFLRKRELDKIGLGTKFVYNLIGQDREEGMLIEGIEESMKIESELKLIRTDSELGQLLLGKKAGSLIEKIVENNQRIVLGTVEEIKTDKKDYLSYIREKSRHNRSSVPARKLTTKLFANSDDEDILKEAKKRQTISLSQQQLLKEEAINLLHTATTKVEKMRLKKVRQLLKEKEVVPLPTDGTIGIGTEFSIMIATKEGLTTKRVELINEAYSNELENEYIERISPLGNKIFGLKEGDSFEHTTFSHDIISAIVFDIDNTKKYEKTNSALVYHVKNVKKGGLVREQIEMLETELIARKKTIEAKKNARKKAGYEVLKDKEINALQERITEINHILTDKKIIENPNSDTIDIGSRCYLSLDYGDGDNETFEATLVERFVSHEASSDEFISMEKEMGQAIYGKQEGEAFSYLLPNGTKITGEVLGIIKTSEMEQKNLQKVK